MPGKTIKGPKRLPINKRIEIMGVIYKKNNKKEINIKKEFLEFNSDKTEWNKIRFCGFQIFNCKMNHFQTLQELKNINFEIPQTQFTNFVSDIDIYLQCWKEGKLFNSYPTSGIVLKINSKKLQKYLGENNLSIHWAYAIN